MKAQQELRNNIPDIKFWSLYLGGQIYEVYP